MFIKFKKVKKKLKDKYIRMIGNIKRKKLNNKNFTIISNNCFGGNVYRINNLKYQSPTCGLFFIAPEYIKFIYNIKKYINKPITEITIDESKYASYLKKIDYKGIIGKIEDIEICFMHYENINEVQEKWHRRTERINWEYIIYKFNDQNLCTYKELKEFNDFNAKNKICFTAKEYSEFNTIQLKQYKDEEFVKSDTFEKDYKKYFDIYVFINKLKKEGK